LAGLIRPSAGVVTFEGTDLATLRPDDLAALRLHRFGFVHQGGELMPELTLVENVEMPLRLAGIRGGAARRAATDLLEGLGVGPAAGRFPHEVSGGQAQRAAVARAVVHGPDVVFADEPTGALDSANGAAVMDLLLHAATEAGSTLVMVTHDLALAGMLDETVEIRDGVVRDRTAGMRA
jgi:putative ABC transport system ATP-binding protein